MTAARAFVVIAIGICLAGCPRPTRLTVHNHSGKEVVIVAAASSVSLLTGEYVTLKDFAFPRDGTDAQALIIRGAFGESCHQIILSGLEYSDDELGTYEESGALLVISASGAVTAVRRGRGASTGPLLPDPLTAGRRLPRCDMP